MNALITKYGMKAVIPINAMNAMNFMNELMLFPHFILLLNMHPSCLKYMKHLQFNTVIHSNFKFKCLNFNYLKYLLITISFLRFR